MVDSMTSAVKGIATAIATFDDASRHLSQPGPTKVEEMNHISHGPDGTPVRNGPTTDLSGSPDVEWPPGSVFAPGFLHADRRGLVAWPGLDAQLTRFLARRSVQANATVIRQARESYDDINALGSHRSAS
jgi:hypothetical protein